VKVERDETMGTRKPRHYYGIEYSGAAMATDERGHLDGHVTIFDNPDDLDEWVKHHFSFPEDTGGPREWISAAEAYKLIRRGKARKA